MERTGLKNLFPWGAIAPFIFFIIFEYLIAFGLDYYKQNLDNKVSTLEVALTKEENLLNEDLKNNESFFVFSQVKNIVDIVQQRKSFIQVINKFNSIMPNSAILKLKVFEFDANNNEIKIEGTVDNWNDYVKVHNYLANLNEISVKSFTSPKSEGGLIKFSMVINLKPSFYQQ